MSTTSHMNEWQDLINSILHISQKHFHIPPEKCQIKYENPICPWQLKNSKFKSLSFHRSFIIIKKKSVLFSHIWICNKIIKQTLKLHVCAYANQFGLFYIRIYGELCSSSLFFVHVSVAMKTKCKNPIYISFQVNRQGTLQNENELFSSETQ